MMNISNEEIATCGYLDNFYPTFVDLHELYTKYLITKAYEDEEESKHAALEKLISTAYTHCKEKAESVTPYSEFNKLCFSKISLQNCILRELKKLCEMDMSTNKKRAEKYVENLIQHVLMPEEVSCTDCRHSGL
ncbi:hypothetical protein [Candidatus Terasakiella magnetica]|nr:hypothetical protein [Candidatus Terasakiella magnetica]